MSGLPEGFEEQDKDAWMALAKSGDAAERKQVSNCLRALGYDPPMFLTWGAEDRVAKILEHQEGSGKKSSSKSGKTGKTGKTANKNKAAASGKGSSGGGDTGPLIKDIEGLTEKVSELGEALDVSMDYIRETHTMMRVFFQGDETSKNNLDELGNYFHGKLLGLEEEEESDDED